MGCGESKHVATGNTISRKNSRAGSKRGSKTLETIEETSKLDRNTSSLMKEEGKSVDRDSGTADNSRALADGNGVAESTELNKQENVENGVLKENEEPIEGLAFEAISERSGKESLSNENLKVADALEDQKLAEEIKEETKEDALEDKKLAEDTEEETLKDQKLAEEKKVETSNGESETLKGENLVDETKTAETTEAKVSTPVVKEEETPAKDSKT